MPTLCPVCLRHDHACICIERSMLAPTDHTVHEWGTEGFRFVGYRESAANPDKEYAVYRKHPEAK